MVTNYAMKKSNQVNKYWIEDNDFCKKSTTDAFVNCDSLK